MICCLREFKFDQTCCPSSLDAGELVALRCTGGRGVLGCDPQYDGK